jgi:threonine/homoserine/homoserine lactone efflux protein
MPELSSLLVFATASFVLLITPGPAVLYIVTRSVDQGRIAGIVSTLGVGTGSLVHVFAAALGLSALLVSSATAFMVVKYLGAAYLIYLGLRKILEKNEHTEIEATQPQKLSRIYRQGVIVNIFNPKLALFFLAFLPQFVDPARGVVAWQILLLGMIFVVLGIFSDSTYALMAGTAGNWLKTSKAFLFGQRYISGGIYIAMGITAAFAGTHRSK